MTLKSKSNHEQLPKEVSEKEYPQLIKATPTCTRVFL